MNFLDIISDYNQRTVSENPLDVRIGISSGSSLYSVIGKRKLQFDIWGEAHSTAQHLSSKYIGVIDHILVSETTHKLLTERYEFSVDKKISIESSSSLISTFIIKRKKMVRDESHPFLIEGENIL